jgi:hypothetical protein
MPQKRRAAGGSLASYFHGSANGDVDDGLGPPVRAATTSRPGKNAGAAKAITFLPADEKASFLKYYDSHGNWLGPGNDPAKKKKRGRSRSKAPREKKHGEGGEQESHEKGPNAMRHEHKAGMMRNAEAMKEHFKNAERIYEQHASWPLTRTHALIKTYIEKCKADIAEVRQAHTGPGAHKDKIEAVHARMIEVTGWDFKAIDGELHAWASQVGVVNRLLMDRPYFRHGGGNHVYVNVVIAWLFAAKRQLMSTLEADLKKKPSTPSIKEFIEESDKGREARSHYKTHKEALGHKHHTAGKYTLQDEEDLKHQHDVIYGSA